MNGPCRCGHAPAFCHRENARKWCGGTAPLSPPEADALLAALERVEALTGRGPTAGMSPNLRSAITKLGRIAAPEPALTDAKGEQDA
jgi:hypothetical protein